MKIVNIKEHSEYQEIMTNYFITHWASDDSKMVYVDCIENSKSKDSLSNWYLLLDEDKVIGCAGLISNDFVSRMDLLPYLCALYIEEDYRGHNYGSLLIEKIKEDVSKMGYDYLYLCSDHVGYYEHFGFNRIATGYHPWGETSEIFRCLVNKNKYELVSNVKALIDNDTHKLSILANVTVLLKKAFVNTSWAGLYLSNDDFTNLYLGPFQGDLACVNIPFGKGVCGTSALSKTSQVVGDVSKCSNHIACSELTSSEVVVPIIKDNKVYGVIDLDSTVLNNYSLEDVKILEEVALLLSRLF